MMTSLFEMMHNPPLERQETCPEHGDYISKCFLGKAWTHCPRCQEMETQALQLEHEEAEAELRLVRYQERIGGAGIPKLFFNRTLASYKVETKEQRYCLDWAQKFVAGFDHNNGQCLIFSGKPGTGKTHLACGIAIELLNKNRTVLFTTMLRMIRQIKDGWNVRTTERSSIAQFVDCDLLIIDEVGVQFGSQTELMYLNDIFNERYGEQKSVIFLTNLPKSGLMEYLGERVVDRLKETKSHCITFDWGSYRSKVL